MDFKEIKEFIETNKEALDLFTPSFNLYGIACEMLRRINDAIEAPEGTEPEPLSDELRRDINCSLEQVVEAAIDVAYSEKEKKIIDCLVLIYNNFNELYNGCIDKPYFVRLLSILVAVERTLEDNIYLNCYLFGKVRSWFVEESATTQLSRKYFDEYMHFLEGKEHKDDYSLRCE